MADLQSADRSGIPERIRLGQFLKLAGLADTGGEAKMLIQDGAVLVNGEACLQRGRHLNPGDLVEVEGRGSCTVSDCTD